MSLIRPLQNEQARCSARIFGIKVFLARRFAIVFWWTYWKNRTQGGSLWKINICNLWSQEKLGLKYKSSVSLKVILPITSAISTSRSISAKRFNNLTMRTLSCADKMLRRQNMNWVFFKNWFIEVFDNIKQSCRKKNDITPRMEHSGTRSFIKIVSGQVRFSRDPTS